MATVPPMRHRLFVLLLLAVVAASCSSGADESEAASSPDSTQPDASVTTPETPETATTEGAETDDANQTVSGADDFCDALRRQEDEEIDVTDPEAVEVTLREAQETLASMVDNAPTEIRPAFVEFVEASERAIELYAEYDFDLFAIPVSEIEAAQTAGLEAQNQVVEFCGLDDLEEPPDADASSGDDVPEALFSPPGLEDSSTTGIMTTMSSGASFEDVVDHYVALVGKEPRVLSDTPGEREVTMSGASSSTGPPSFILWVQEDEGQVIVTVSVPES